MPTTSESVRSNMELATKLDSERFVSVSAAAELLSVSEVTIRRFLTQKRLRRFKVGGPNGRTLVRVSDLMKLVKEAK